MEPTKLKLSDLYGRKLNCDLKHEDGALIVQGGRLITNNVIAHIQASGLEIEPSMLKPLQPVPTTWHPHEKLLVDGEVLTREQVVARREKEIEECEEQARRNALDVQTGGNHYKNMKIQPVEFIHANEIPYIEGSIIKYICRHRSKNGLEDLRKARHFIDILIELEHEK